MNDRPSMQEQRPAFLDAMSATGSSERLTLGFRFLRVPAAAVWMWLVLRVFFCGLPAIRIKDGGDTSPSKCLSILGQVHAIPHSIPFICFVHGDHARPLYWRGIDEAPRYLKGDCW